MELKKGYKQTEIGVLPEDWCVSKLCENTKDITDYVAAGSFASLKENIKVFDNREHAVYVRLYDLRLGLMHLNQKYVDKSSYEFLCRSNLHGGEILLANIGANVGETWIMPQIEYPATIAPNMIVIRTADTRLNNLFCYHFTHSSVGKKGITTLVGGSGHPKVNKTELKSLLIPLPPLPEQKAIATVLSDMDELIESLTKLIGKKKNIKKAAMQDLLTGKKRLLGFSAEWGKKKIIELFEITAGGDLRKPEFSLFQTDQHPYPIFSNAISNNGLYGYCSTFDFNENCLTITARGSIGFALNRNNAFCAIGRLLVLKPLHEYSCKFFAEYINQNVSFPNESTGVPQLTIPQVSERIVTVPTFIEQNAIAQVLSDMDVEIEKLEMQKQKTIAVKQAAMQDLLTGKKRLV